MDPKDNVGDVERLSDAVCQTIIKFGRKYRKITPLTAVKMEEAFFVDTGHGIEKGKAGDWLAADNQGKFYPIDAEEFARTFRPFRQHKEKVKKLPVSPRPKKV